MQFKRNPKIYKKSSSVTDFSTRSSNHSSRRVPNESEVKALIDKGSQETLDMQPIGSVNDAELSVKPSPVSMLIRDSIHKQQTRDQLLSGHNNRKGKVPNNVLLSAEKTSAFLTNGGQHSHDRKSTSHQFVEAQFLKRRQFQEDKINSAPKDKRPPRRILQRQDSDRSIGAISDVSSISGDALTRERPNHIRELNRRRTVSSLSSGSAVGTLASF